MSEAGKPCGCLCRVMVMAGLAAQAVGFTPAAPIVRSVLRAPTVPSPLCCRGGRTMFAQGNAARGPGEGSDTPLSNSTAPAAAAQTELEASVRELTEQLEEKDATILRLRSELEALQERLGNQSESLPPPPTCWPCTESHTCAALCADSPRNRVPSRAPPALTDVQRRALEASLNVKETEEMEAQLLVKMMREMGLGDRDIAHVMRERDRIKPPKPGEVPWAKRGISKRVAKWLGLHAIE